MKYLVLDTETVGMYSNLKISAEDIKNLGYKNIKEINLLIEFSYILYDDKLSPIKLGNTLCKADIPQSFESMEKNNITPEMLKDKNSFENTNVYQEIKEILKNEKIILIGHNIPFDLEILSVFDLNINNYKTIDTLQLTKYFQPDEPKRLTYLYYKEKIYNNIDKIINSTLKKTKTPKKGLILEHHHSLYDVFVTTEYLKILLNRNKIDLNTAFELSNQKVVYEKMPYGKYKDSLISDLEDNYIIYFMKNNIDDKNLKFTFEKEIEKRGGYDNIFSKLSFFQLEKINNEQIENQEMKKSIEKTIKSKESEQLIFSFGKHSGKHISEVYENDKQYLDFMLGINKLNKYMLKYLKEKN